MTSTLDTKTLLVVFFFPWNLVLLFKAQLQKQMNETKKTRKSL